MLDKTWQTGMAEKKRSADTGNPKKFEVQSNTCMIIRRGVGFSVILECYYDREWSINIHLSIQARGDPEESNDHRHIEKILRASREI